MHCITSLNTQHAHTTLPPSEMAELECVPTSLTTACSVHECREI